MHYKYKCNGTCSVMVEFDITEDRVHNINFVGGCSGNLKGISALAEGLKIENVIDRLKGIKCNVRSTSCPDQLAMALEKIKESSNVYIKR